MGAPLRRRRTRRGARARR